jgi:glycosyltransferase involved in cell wall biosynthesis
MLRDPELRRRLSLTSRQSITSRFSWERAGDQLEAIYGEAVRLRREALGGAP